MPTGAVGGAIWPTVSVVHGAAPNEARQLRCVLASGRGEVTEQQLEAAARKLCEIRCIDPDFLVSHAAPPTDRGYVPAVLLHLPAWRLAVSELRNFYALAKAIDFGMGMEQLP